MDRRTFLQTTGLSIGLATAGCTSGDSGSASADSDGDGISDAEDYAPRDPAVQVKADITATARQTTTTSETTTRATTQPTTVPTTRTTTTQTTTVPTTTQQPDNRIAANYAPIQEAAAAYFKWYSLSESQIALDTAGFDAGELGDEMRFVVAAQVYPNESVLDLVTTDASRIQDGFNEFTISQELDVQTDSEFFLSVFAIPKGSTFEAAADSGTGVFLCESDRLRVRDGVLEKAPHPDAHGTLRTEQYERISGEGLYVIRMTGAVDFGLTVFKHAYIDSNQRVTKRARDVVWNSYRSGLSKTLASIVHDAAVDAGYSTTRGRINYAVQAIQALPYVSDTLDNNFDTYNKYPIETLVEGGGDCEDSVILLAATLLSQPYGYGMVLILLPYENPTHIALGIKGSEDVAGTYYTYEGERYFYTETTGEGWEIGELPDEYRDMSARIISIT